MGPPIRFRLRSGARHTLQELDRLLDDAYGAPEADLDNKDDEIERLEDGWMHAEARNGKQRVAIGRQKARVAELEAIPERVTKLAVYAAERKIKKLQARLRAYDGLEKHFGIDDD